jgi:3-methylcrotonyl-CoA carboxylase beta subunit
MAKLILHPLGAPVDVEAPEFQKNAAAMAVIDTELSARKSKIAEGWGAEYQDRVHQKGKLTAYERIAALADNSEDILPFNTFVNYGREFGDDGQKKSCPNAGVITTLVKIHDRWVMVIANDNTVASGSWWPLTPQKIIRAQEMALKVRLPVVYLVDCSGLFLPEQGQTFPGKKGAGHIFKMNSLLSAAGVPQIAGVCGDCIAGGGYMPIISDRVFMTESSYMVIAGAALIRGAKSQHLSSHDIGGPHVHVHLSNCADERVATDQEMIIKIKAEIAKLPTSAASYYRTNGAQSAAPKYDVTELSGLMPVNARASYDIRQIIARLVDDSLFHEFDPAVGQEVVCGMARICGLWVGLLANAQGLFDHPHHPGQKRPGGILYREGVQKLSRFSRMLNEDGVPLIWLMDVAGFDVGLEAEKQGLLSYGSSLIYANSTHQTPMMTVLLRKASGAGFYAMAGMPYDPLWQISTPFSRLAVMEGQTLAIGAFHTKLDDDFNIVASSPEEKSKIESAMNQVSLRIEKDMDPYKNASLMDTDEIVSLVDLRQYLLAFAEVSYQATGYRRIKNPRIWSLFDQNAP